MKCAKWHWACAAVLATLGAVTFPWWASRPDMAYY